MRCTFGDIHYLRVDGYFHECYSYDSLQACLTVGMVIPHNYLSSLLLVNGGYSEWKPYSVCSKTCGGGVQTRNRTCTNPPPSYNGEDCSRLGPNKNTRECNNRGCPGKMNKTQYTFWRWVILHTFVLKQPRPSILPKLHHMIKRPFLVQRLVYNHSPWW